MQLRNDPTTCEERVASLADALRGLYGAPAEPSPILRGRRAAPACPATFDPRDYARPRLAGRGPVELGDQESV